MADRALPIALIAVLAVAESHLPRDAEEEGIAHLFRQSGEGHGPARAEMFDDGQERALQIGRALLVGRAEEDLLVHALVRFGDELRRVNFEHHAETVAAFARAVGRVERERARL